MVSTKIINSKQLVGEFLGTFGMVYFCSIIAMHGDVGNLNLLGIGFANFLILMIMVYSTYSLSGAHLNPAVTLGFMITKKMDISQGLIYIIIQLIASIIAGIFLLFLSGDELLNAAKNSSGLGFPHLNPNYSIIIGLFFEILMTFFLVFVIWSVAIDTKITNQLIGVAVGGVVGFNILVGGPITGAAMNPARVFGPALIISDFSNHWIYWIGPIIGGISAAFLYNYLLDKPINNDN